MDVISIVHDLLLNSAVIEDAHGIDDLEFVGSNCAPPLGGEAPLNAHDDWIELLARDALGNHIGGGDGVPGRVVSGCAAIKGATTALFSVDVELAIHRTESGDRLIEKCKVAREYLAAGALERLVGCAEPVSDWANAKSIGVRMAALKVHWLRRAATQGRVLSLRDCPSFQFGSKFIASIRPYGFANDPSKIRRLLDAMSDSLSDLETRQVHPLRVDKGANSAQRTRGNQKAWRRDVDDEFHLHYWAGGGQMEFGQVGPHNDYGLE